MVIWRTSYSSKLVTLSRLSVRAIQTSAGRNHAVTQRPSIAELLRPSNLPDGDSEHTLVVTGFVQSIRTQKRVAFAALSDGSSLEPVQVVMSPVHAERLSTGAAVSITGNWKRCPPGKEQSHELQATDVELLGYNDATTYPIQKKYHTPEYLRTIPHLRTRTAHNALLLRLRSQVIADVTAFFSERGFIQSHTPVITSSDCEGAGEVFTVSANSAHHGGSNPTANVPFFRSPKYLTVSSQLHLEALAQSVGNVWTLSPTFRAEKSDTARHLSEFYMLEVEMAFATRHGQVMDVVENLLRAVASKLKTSTIGQELQSDRSRTKQNTGESTQSEISISSGLLQRWDGLIRGPWPRITYHTAIERLREAALSGKASFEYPPDAADGLQAEHERYLAEDVGENGPVFVTDYPRVMKPFYMAPSHESTGDCGALPTVACFDLLLPEVCEVVGGSMREHRLDELLTAMREKGLTKRDAETPEKKMEGDAAATEEHSEEQAGLDWYLDLRRYGSVPHGGFGLGFDRLLAYLGGVSNIRDVVTFPRWHGRCVC